MASSTLGSSRKKSATRDIYRPLGLARRHKDTEKTSRPERRRPRRHQHFIAMTPRQVHPTQCVKIRGEFLPLRDSSACLKNNYQYFIISPSDWRALLCQRLQARLDRQWLCPTTHWYPEGLFFATGQVHDRLSLSIRNSLALCIQEPIFQGRRRYEPL
jgi:hypothetical protein